MAAMQPPLPETVENPHRCIVVVPDAIDVRGLNTREVERP
jgi:hypothetical protein